MHASTRAKSASAEPIYDFKTSKDGDSVVMDVFVKQSSAAKILSCLTILIPSLIVIDPTRGKSLYLAIPCIVYLIYLLARRGKNVVTTRIVIDANQISVPRIKKAFDIKHVRSVGWGPTASAQGSSQTVVVGSNPGLALYAGAQNVGQMAGEHVRHKYGYCIYVVYGSRREIIVAGLHEHVVETIYNEFSKNLAAFGHAYS
jgi:hypothetical protein